MRLRWGELFKFHGRFIAGVNSRKNEFLNRRRFGEVTDKKVDSFTRPVRMGNLLLKNEYHERDDLVYDRRKLLLTVVLLIGPLILT